jgi:class 3 adenylate cyclase
VTARLAAAAGPGEILVTARAATVAGGIVAREHRSLQLKGKSGLIDVVVVTSDEPDRAQVASP